MPTKTFNITQLLLLLLYFVYLMATMYYGFTLHALYCCIAALVAGSRVVCVCMLCIWGFCGTFNRPNDRKALKIKSNQIDKTST